MTTQLWEWDEKKSREGKDIFLQIKSYFYHFPGKSLPIFPFIFYEYDWFNQVSKYKANRLSDQLIFLWKSDE